MTQDHKRMGIALRCLAVWAVTAMTSSATTLIDYDDGNDTNSIHNADIRDGGFETDVGDGVDGAVSSGGTFWNSTSTNAWQLKSNQNSPGGGGQNTVVGMGDVGVLRQVGQDTGHILALGDQFSGSFDWRNSMGWDLGETIDMILFYTDDDTLGGARSEVFTLNSGDETADLTWETEILAQTPALTDEAAVSKKLFVAFEANGVNTNSFARLDNVYLFTGSGTSFPPEWIENPISGTQGLMGRDYTGTLNGKAMNPNGDVITFSKTSDASSWLVVDSDGSLSGIPDVLGTNTFTVTATTIEGSTDSTLTIFVAASLPPVWDADPIDGGVAFIDGVYSGTLADVVTDPEGDAITYSLDNAGLTWLTVDALSGALSGTPALSDQGTNDFTVVATAVDGATSAILKIVVQEVPEGGLVLIDYDDQIAGNGIHETDVRNGGMELNTFWAPTGTDPVQYKSNLNSPIGGQNVVLGMANEANGGGTIHLGQDTGHVLALGDQFSGSFDWRDAWLWDAGETIDMLLFYTDDDTLAGVRTEVFTLNSGDETVDNTWETKTLYLTSALTDGGAVGKKLFVAFEGNGVGLGSFARVDNIHLTVIAGSIAPEEFEISIAGSDIGDNSVVISWESSSYASYRVQTNVNLSLPDNWYDYDTRAGNGGVLSVTNIMSADQVFYRVISE